MKCSNCGQDNPAGMRFCGRCGAPLGAPGPGRAVTPPPSAPVPVAAAPPVMAAPRPARQGRSCGCCLGPLLLILLVIIGGAGLLYVLVQNGTISQRQIRNATGLGTGEINIVNLADDNLDVTLTRLDTQSGSPDDVGSLTLGSLDIDGFASIAPGRYRVNFAAAGGTPISGDCTLRMESGDYYQFAAAPEGIVVSRQKEPAQTGSDLNITTAPVCQR